MPIASPDCPTRVLPQGQWRSLLAQNLSLSQFQPYRSRATPTCKKELDTGMGVTY
jgi:hypothetical protein